MMHKTHREFAKHISFEWLKLRLATLKSWNVGIIPAAAAGNIACP